MMTKLSTAHLALIVIAATAVAATAGRSAQAAGLTLTSAGVNQGLSLTTFASGFPNLNVGSGSAGPLGIAFPTTGGVLVSDYPGNVRHFPPTSMVKTRPMHRSVRAMAQATRTALLRSMA